MTRRYLKKVMFPETGKCGRLRILEAPQHEESFTGEVASELG